MRNFNKSIEYMKCEMNKQTEAHRQPYRDAIEAMEQLSSRVASITNNTQTRRPAVEIRQCIDLSGPVPIPLRRHNVINPKDFRSGEAANEIFR